MSCKVRGGGGEAFGAVDMELRFNGFSSGFEGVGMADCRLQRPFFEAAARQP